MSLFGSMMPAIMNSITNQLTGNFSTYGANGPFGNYSSNMQSWNGYGQQGQGQQTAQQASQNGQANAADPAQGNHLFGPALSGAVPYMNTPTMPGGAGLYMSNPAMSPMYGAQPSYNGGYGRMLGNLGTSGYVPLNLYGHGF